MKVSSSRISILILDALSTAFFILGIDWISNHGDFMKSAHDHTLCREKDDNNRFSLSETGQRGAIDHCF